MSLFSQHQELISCMKAGWADETPVDYPNCDFTPPQPAPDAKWARFTIKDDDDPQALSQITIGGEVNFHRFTGVIIVQIFTGTGIGSGPALHLAEKVIDIYKAFVGTNIVCRIGKGKEIGTANGWYQVNVTVPYYRDELL